MLPIKIKLIKIKIWDLQMEIENQILNINLTLKFDYKKKNELSAERIFLDLVRYLMPRANSFVDVLDQGLEQRICTSTVLTLLYSQKTLK